MVDAVALIFGCLYLLVESWVSRTGRGFLGIFPSTYSISFSYRGRRAGAVGRLEGPGTPVLPDRGHCVSGAWAVGPDCAATYSCAIGASGRRFMTDNLLHLMTGIALSYFGFLPGPNSLRGSAQSHDRTG